MKKWLIGLAVLVAFLAIPADGSWDNVILAVVLTLVVVMVVEERAK